MGLADDLLKPAPRKGPECSVAKLLARLDKKDADALRTVLAMNQDEMPTGAIHTRLADAGFSIGQETLRRHRRHGCTCPI